MDVFTQKKRSEVMSRIRGKGNEKTEVRLAKLMRKAGIRGWRRHLPIPGRPDFSFRQQKVAVFVDGCFWHGCPRCFRLPKQKGPIGKRTAKKAGVESCEDTGMSAEKE
jgi:DNA mismatch endonuclease (patch repair protein)